MEKSIERKLRFEIQRVCSVRKQ